ncbi:MAG: putative lipoprotein YddW [Sodalis sp. Psp]|nr:putative lipoprotein YddW [Sodalis sp. Psp]MCR3756865.1 putative lipoprotein YddW [Sodalis sp. Ppy]
MQSNNRMTRWLVIVFCLKFLLGCTHKCNQVPFLPTPPKSKSQAPNMRGVWMATIDGLDWPASYTLSARTDTLRIQQQKKALTDKLDNLVTIGINTVFFQVKPDGTALYHSDLLPWSEVLTGMISQYPGYDPLVFILEEAHKRGLKVHAWLNPYRVATNTRPETIAALKATLHSSPASVYALHPDWIRIASGHFVLDPGLPEVRNWIVSVVIEIVRKYPIDGIQFDDYFYYETPDSQLDDDASYRLYGHGFSEKSNWRRNNTLLLIQQVSQTIKFFKPKVVFGVSPAGIWRNVADDPRGSATQGGRPEYDTAYADTRLWVIQGLLDYIAPQLYWPFGHHIARYDVLVKWWSDVVRYSHTQLYIGVALYKVGYPSQAEPNWSIKNGVPELKRQLDLNDALPGVSGVILFREAYLSQSQTAAVVNYLTHRWRGIDKYRLIKHVRNNPSSVTTLPGRLIKYLV